VTEKRLICVSCPLGCEITAEIEEAVEPMRILPTNVKVLRGALPLVSVKTDRPVPRRAIEGIMRFIRELEVEAPVKIGEVLAGDVAGTGAKLVATRRVDRVGESESESPSGGEPPRRQAYRGRT